MAEIWKYFGNGSEVSGLNKKLFHAIRGQACHFEEGSLSKLQCFIDLFDYYYVLKRGEKEDSRDIYKIMETRGVSQTPFASECTI